MLIVWQLFQWLQYSLKHSQGTVWYTEFGDHSDFLICMLVPGQRSQKQPGGQHSWEAGSMWEMQSQRFQKAHDWLNHSSSHGLPGRPMASLPPFINRFKSITFTLQKNRCLFHYICLFNTHKNSRAHLYGKERNSSVCRTDMRQLPISSKRHLGLLGLLHYPLISCLGLVQRARYINLMDFQPDRPQGNDEQELQCSVRVSLMPVSV